MIIPGLKGLMERVARFAAPTESSPIAARFEFLQLERARRRAELESYEATHGSQPVVPTCEEMCPEYEQVERELHLDVHPFEAKLGAMGQSGSGYVMDPAKAVKKYHRPAAGNEAPLPEDIRTPECLRRTLFYLLHDILDNKQYPFTDIHSFIRDRTRSIRQDLTLQGCRDPRSVELHEQIARFHIISGHLLCEADPAEFDAFQNTEQLRKVLQSLHELYSDSKNVVYENEPEFRAYYVLTHLQDPTIFRSIMEFSPHLLSSRFIQFALKAAAAFHQGNYAKFCLLIQSGDYLQSALLFTHLTFLRSKALEIMGQAYNEGISLYYIQHLLLFQDFQETSLFLTAHGLSVNEHVRLDGLIKPTESIRARKLDLIDAKVLGRPLSVTVCNKPILSEPGKDQILRFKVSLKDDLYGALVDFCIPILARDIVISVFNGFVSSFSSSIAEYKKQLRLQLTTLLLGQFLQEFCTEIVEGVLREQQQSLLHSKRHEAVERVYAQISESAIEDLVWTVCLESCADHFFNISLLSSCFARWLGFYKSRHTHRTNERHYRDRIRSESTATSTILHSRYSRILKPSRTIDLDALFNFANAVVWITFAPCDANIKFATGGRVEVIWDLYKCPHLAICLPAEKACIVERIASLNVPWPVFCASVDELFGLILDNQVPALIPISKDLLAGRLLQITRKCVCSAEYRIKLNRYIEDSVHFLYEEDPAKGLHPNPLKDAVFPDSLDAIEGRLKEMLIGLESAAVHSPRRKRSSPSSPPPDLAPQMKCLERISTLR